MVSSRRRRRILISVIAAIVAIGVALVIWAQLTTQPDTPETSPDAAESSAPSSASASPKPQTPESDPSPSDTATAPTDEAKPSATASASASDSNASDDGVARDPQPVLPTEIGADGRVVADLQVTTWSTTRPFSAAGFIPTVVEDGGTCTLTLTRGDVTLSATGTATSNAANTVCAQGLTIDDTRLVAGDWTMTLAYSSARYEAASAQMKVQVN